MTLLSIIQTFTISNKLFAPLSIWINGCWLYHQTGNNVQFGGKSPNQERNVSECLKLSPFHETNSKSASENSDSGRQILKSLFKFSHLSDHILTSVLVPEISHSKKCKIAPKVVYLLSKLWGNSEICVTPSGVMSVGKLWNLLCM